MSDNASDDEPTMEEILASIRRIISDESEDEEPEAEAGGEEEPAPEPEPVVEPEPDPEPEPEPAPEPEPVPEPAPEPEPEPEPVPEPMPEPEPVPEPLPEPEPEPVYAAPQPEPEDVFELTEFATDGDVEAIVSPPTENEAALSFSHLTHMMVSGYDGAENTLEALVREMLKPMLQGWLDQNLPQIVQDAVEREVARIARRK